MKISVIIPVYNAEIYIRKCLESVISQTYEKWEIIAIDDGSNDNSYKILKEYAERDSRIKIETKKMKDRDRQEIKHWIKQQEILLFSLMLMII